MSTVFWLYCSLFVPTIFGGFFLLSLIMFDHEWCASFPLLSAPVYPGLTGISPHTLAVHR